MDSIVFISGASSGFGRACAEKFAAAGHSLIITGRRDERLQDLKNILEQEHKVKVLTLCFDVQDPVAVSKAVGSMSAYWQKIDILINNAGLAAGRDYFDEALMSDWETMIDTNVKGLLYVTRAILPFMTQRGKGHIINIGSIAGKEVYEKGNVYCASKHAVDALSAAMRIDLLRHRIKVTAIHPGAAETEFSLVRFKGNKDQAKKIYEGYKPLAAEDIAETVFYCVNLPAHVCINDLTITPLAQANSFYVYRD